MSDKIIHEGSQGVNDFRVILREADKKIVVFRRHAGYRDKGDEYWSVVYTGDKFINGNARALEYLAQLGLNAIKEKHDSDKVVVEKPVKTEPPKSPKKETELPKEPEQPKESK